MRKGFGKGIWQVIQSEMSDKVRLYSTHSEGLEVGRELVINWETKFRREGKIIKYITDILQQKL